MRRPTKQRPVSDEGVKAVTQHHKSRVDAATELMDKALDSIVHRDHRHAIELLKCAIAHLEVAAIIENVLKDIPGAITEK
jgi:hypothetical protein